MTAPWPVGDGRKARKGSSDLQLTVPCCSGCRSCVRAGAGFSLCPTCARMCAHITVGIRHVPARGLSPSCPLSSAPPSSKCVPPNPFTHCYPQIRNQRELGVLISCLGKIMGKEVCFSSQLWFIITIEISLRAPPWVSGPHQHQLIPLLHFWNRCLLL